MIGFSALRKLQKEGFTVCDTYPKAFGAVLGILKEHKNDALYRKIM